MQAIDYVVKILQSILDLLDYLLSLLLVSELGYQCLEQVIQLLQDPLLQVADLLSTGFLVHLLLQRHQRLLQLELVLLEFLFQVADALHQVLHFLLAQHGALQLWVDVFGRHLHARHVLGFDKLLLQVLYLNFQHLDPLSQSSDVFAVFSDVDLEQLALVETMTQFLAFIELFLSQLSPNCVQVVYRGLGSQAPLELGNAVSELLDVEGLEVSQQLVEKVFKLYYLGAGFLQLVKVFGVHT